MNPKIPSVLKVMLIQACQNFAHGENQAVRHPNADPAEIYHPEDRRHITLRRPHTALLLATVTGGQAIRGAYTGSSNRLSVFYSEVPLFMDTIPNIRRLVAAILDVYFGEYRIQVLNFFI